MYLDSLVKNVEGEPHFKVFPYLDYNPVSGNRKRRWIHAPNESMEIIHKRFLHWLRKHVSWRVNHSHVTGARPGNSSRKNAKRHWGQRFYYLTDIHDAYHQVDGLALAWLITSLHPWLNGKEQEVLAWLEKYCLDPKEGGLRVGAPTSPDLFNLYTAYYLDRRLSRLCQEKNLIYSRYLDDLTFSCRQRITNRTRKEIRTIIGKAGFSVSHRKSQVLDIQKGPVVINGVGLTKNGDLFLPRHVTRRIAGFLHSADPACKMDQDKANGLIGLYASVSGSSTRFANNTERRVVRKIVSFRHLAKQAKAAK